MDTINNQIFKWTTTSSHTWEHPSRAIHLHMLAIIEIPRWRLTRWQSRSRQRLANRFKPLNPLLKKIRLSWMLRLIKKHRTVRTLKIFPRALTWKVTTIPWSRVISYQIPALTKRSVMAIRQKHENQSRIEADFFWLCRVNICKYRS